MMVFAALQAGLPSCTIIFAAGDNPEPCRAQLAECQLHMLDGAVAVGAGRSWGHSSFGSSWFAVPIGLS
jgi:hypothetical protein